MKPTTYGRRRPPSLEANSIFFLPYVIEANYFCSNSLTKEAKENLIHDEFLREIVKSLQKKNIAIGIFFFFCSGFTFLARVYPIVAVSSSTSINRSVDMYDNSFFKRVVQLMESIYNCHIYL